ncbi:MAG: DUF6240 domain-containing protein [Lachnospiraceae bacterium]|jgi:hypothetical protein|nr:DUF6240 domain-containing protein [Lachnospiraceae bacterium]
MNLNFANIPENKAILPGKNTAAGAYSLSKSLAAGAADNSVKGVSFRIDINGNAIHDSAYGKKARSVEDVMRAAGAIDVTTNRNYLAVMAASMSQEDFARLQSDGIDPGNTEIETVVTILDHIKSALIMGGTQVEGFTDDLSSEQLTAITGNQALAQNLTDGELSQKDSPRHQLPEHDLPQHELTNQELVRHELEQLFRERNLSVTEENITQAMATWEKVRDITTLSDGAIKYIIENQLSLSLDNLYLAIHSGGNDAERQGSGYFAEETSGGENGRGGYLSQKASEYDWEKLIPQIKKMLTESGFPDNESNVNIGRWLIEKGVPLTSENIVAIQRINDLSLPISPRQFAAVTAAAVADGKNPLTADLFNHHTDVERAVAWVEGVYNALPYTATPASSLGHYANTRSETLTLSEVDLTTAKSLFTHLNLAETSLTMTAAAAVRLLRSGLNIETTPMKQLVAELRVAEQSIRMHLMGTENDDFTTTRQHLYHDTITKVDDIATMPAALIGQMTHIATSPRSAQAIPVTLDDIHATGEKILSSYEAASKTYEQVMTAPRRDLGDSIKTAFRNVEAILTEMGIETTDENCRAVRILGYNSMEINEENISAIKEKDLLLQSVIAAMKPGAVLALIREGYNPLQMPLDELRDILHGKNETLAESFEDYSRFLARLDRRGDITEDERSAFINLYRLVRQVEKGDSAVIGTLVNAKGHIANDNIINTLPDLSLAHVLTALRSDKRQGMDYLIDRHFGGTQALHDDPYSEWMKNDAKTLPAVPDTVIETLLTYQQPLTLNNLIAANRSLSSSAFLQKKATSLAKDTELEAVLADANERLITNFTDEANVTSSFSHLHQVMADIFTHTSLQADVTALDVKELSSMCRQLYIEAAMRTARPIRVGEEEYYQEEYSIPLGIDGEITAVNLRLRHGVDVKGQVSCQMTTQSLGSVSAMFALSGGFVNGHIIGIDANGLKKMSAEADNLYTIISNLLPDETTLGTIHFVHGNTPVHQGTQQNYSHGRNDTIKIKEEQEENRKDAQKISNKELYLVAKGFITFVSQWGKETD